MKTRPGSHQHMMGVWNPQEQRALCRENKQKGPTWTPASRTCGEGTDRGQTEERGRGRDRRGKGQMHSQKEKQRPVGSQKLREETF